jgi:hypothetical protein
MLLDIGAQGVAEIVQTGGVELVHFTHDSNQHEGLVYDPAKVITATCQLLLTDTSFQKHTTESALTIPCKDTQHFLLINGRVLQTGNNNP